MSIDVAFSVNRALALPVMVTINSIVQNAQHPDDLRFNIVIPPDAAPDFQPKIDAAFPNRRHQFRLIEYLPPKYMRDYLDARFKPDSLPRQNSRYMQYSRLFFKTAMPDVTRLIYFDADIIVLGDVGALYAQGAQLNAEQYVGAVPQNFPAWGYFSNPLKGWSEIQQFTRTFNSGVLLTDLSFWTEETYNRLHHYLNWDAESGYKLYNLGDETVMNLMFKRDYLPLDASWNRCGYGNTQLLTWLFDKDPTGMNVIHWSGGHHKPWRSKRIPFGQLWKSYRPEALA
ncbi:MAG: glycosyltransferase [Cyanobacteria bacterium P01_A01_bin.105]